MGISRRQLMLLTVASAACRLEFDPLPDTELELTIVGHGALVGDGIACADHCTYSLAVPVNLEVHAPVGWQLASIVPPCGEPCLAEPGDHVIATFERPPIVANRIFVTSSHVTAATGIGGLDAFCAERAAAGGLSGTFVALVSAPGTPAAQRLAGSRGSDPSRARVGCG
jgi:hypothetical protein